ncbi:MAG: 30S ribosomal protein S6 [Dehalococcoidia bacterium]
MHNYELTAIIRPDIDEEDVPQVKDRIANLITEHGGTVNQVNHWGRRKLAYPIRNFGEGNYVMVELQSEPGNVGEIKSDLNLSEEVFRYLLVRLDN